MSRIEIPADFAVQPLTSEKARRQAKEPAQCGACGLWWDDGVVTDWTPAPSARCPFEYFHEEEEEEEESGAALAWDQAKWSGHTLAEKCARDPVWRGELGRRLTLFSQVETYAGQQAERVQSLAAFLTNALREGEGEGDD